MTQRWIFATALLSMIGCSSSVDVSGGDVDADVDSSSTDGGLDAPDGAQVDTGMSGDTAGSDTGKADTAGLDSVAIDSAAVDTGVAIDSATVDTGVVDSAPSDTGTIDSAPMDTGVRPDSGGGGCGAGGACAGGLRCCDGACVNEGNDPFNCGGCGVRCAAPSSMCAGGHCGTPLCAPGCVAGQTCCELDGPGPTRIQCVAGSTCPVGCPLCL